MTDVGQVEVPKVAAEVAWVVELPQRAALGHMLLPEASHLPLQDGLGVDPAVGVLAVCPGEQACGMQHINQCLQGGGKCGGRPSLLLRTLDDQPTTIDVCAVGIQLLQLQG